MLQPDKRQQQEAKWVPSPRLDLSQCDDFVICEDVRDSETRFPDSNTRFPDLIKGRQGRQGRQFQYDLHCIARIYRQGRQESSKCGSQWRRMPVEVVAVVSCCRKLTMHTDSMTGVSARKAPSKKSSRGLFF